MVVLDTDITFIVFELTPPPRGTPANICIYLIFHYF